MDIAAVVVVVVVVVVLNRSISSTVVRATEWQMKR